MTIRRFSKGEEAALFTIFYSAVHSIASRDYTQEQVNAWAPSTLNETEWTARIRAIHPFVAEIDGTPVGYADIQSSGYIDHFYVSGHHPRQGIGNQLMGTIHIEASRQGINELTAKVSVTAQPFFEKHGFKIVEHLHPIVRGVALTNARMQKRLDQQ